jgi:hypothetical protein
LERFPENLDRPNTFGAVSPLRKTALRKSSPALLLGKSLYCRTVAERRRALFFGCPFATPTFTASLDAALPLLDSLAGK